MPIFYKSYPQCFREFMPMAPFAVINKKGPFKKGANYLVYETNQWA
jgi:hypothetical protein